MKKKKAKKQVTMTEKQIEAGLTACTNMDEIGCSKCPYKRYRRSCLCMYMLMTDCMAHIRHLREKVTLESDRQTMWQFLGTLSSDERAKSITAKLSQLHCKYAVTEFDIFDVVSSVEIEFTEWLESPADSFSPNCYCTFEVPETDCEACEHVLDCTNCYEPSEVKS